MTMMYEMEPIKARGLTFSVTIHADDDNEAPWSREDGHGPVRVSRRESYFVRYGVGDKRPGERALATDRGRAFLYDWQGAMKQARAEGWGLAPEELAKMTARIGREPTRGEVCEAAVRADFNRLRGWLHDEWYYCGVVVTLRDVDGDDVDGETESLWGIESDAGDYLAEVASELAEELASRIGRKKKVTHGARTYRVRR